MSGGGFFGEGDLDDGEEPLNFDFEEALFLGLVDIDDALLFDSSDLVKAANFALDDFGNPDSPLDDFVSSAKGDKWFLFVKEESESSSDVFS